VNSKPLAERLRPQKLADIIGQNHLVGDEGVITQMIANNNVASMIFWGPPGVGKTTLANVIAKELDLTFYQLSAINAGVKDIRAVISNAKKEGKSLLFIDEIHRFNKSQQDSLLGAVEAGTLLLIGATTENPGFEVVSALLSRCQVYTLKHLQKEDLNILLDKAIVEDEVLRQKQIVLEETEALLRFSGGDARKLLNALELVVNSQKGEKVVINNATALKLLQKNIAIYDKSGEQHYDIISAFIKSMRGSDPNAAVYWLARMIEGGEDPKFIARRMLILASEDIGNANPNALLLANACFDAVERLGYPECRITLSQTVIYLATSAKSNASYMAINHAQTLVKQTGDLPVPLSLRNAPVQLMKDLDYGKNYAYAHDYEGNFKAHEFLPEAIIGNTLYDPGNNAKENQMRKQLQVWWQEKYGY